MRLKVLLAVLFAGSLGGAAWGTLRQSGEDVAAVQAALRAELESTKRPTYVTADREGTRLWKLTRDFYGRRNFTPAWIEDKLPKPQMGALFGAIRTAEREGLDPELYGIGILEARRRDASRGFLTKKGFEATEAGRLDALLTYIYMKYSSDLADGVGDLAHADPAWRIEPERFNPLDHLEQAIADNRVQESLQALTPTAPQYTALRDTLADYRQRAAQGPWPPVPRSLKLRPGQKSAGVSALARRLAASGDYQGEIPPDGVAPYGPELADAVRRFQRQHGLEPDGVIGPAVVSQLNVPLEARVNQIALNLERWRWLPREPGPRHILVNIPGYRLEVWENGSVQLAMRVVVGRKDTPTPIFNDTMTHLVFSPYWNIPPGIAKNETLPSMLMDGAFLARNNLEVIDEEGQVIDPATIDMAQPERYRFRQRPGSGNSLGLVKFMFPNQFNVYLHDTPADSLFDRAERAFSHGCVRVEQPRELAAYVLRDQPDWTAEKIEAAMHGDEERTVKLKSPIPVYLGYWTAAVTPDGVQFSEDIYGIDARQASMLADRLTRLRKLASKWTARSARTPRGAGSSE